MNKKILVICLIVALTLSAVCLSACKNEDATEKLRQINYALLQDYSGVELQIETKNDEVTLNATYVIANSGDTSNITYQVERLTSFSTDGSIPSGFIEVATGTATVKGGMITSIDGDEVNEAVILDVADTTMSFVKTYFSDIKVTSNGLSANVINPKAFLQNNEFNGTDMTVRVIMSQTYISHIIISYNLDNTAIKLNYTFTV